jgi:hypothetical protein
VERCGYLCPCLLFDDGLYVGLAERRKRAGRGRDEEGGGGGVCK